MRRRVARLLPRSDPGHTGGDRQPGEARPLRAVCPRGSSTCPTTTWPRSSEALDAGAVGAVLLEPIQGEGGVIVPSSDYLAGVRALCDRARRAPDRSTRSRPASAGPGDWFAFQAQDLQPDVVTMAKALGNGMPVGACWARAEVAAAFGPATTGRPSAASPWPCRPPGPRSPSWRPRTSAERARSGPARALAPAWPGCPACVDVRGAGPAAGRRLDGPERGRGRGRRPSPTGCSSTRCGPTRLRVAPPLLVSDARSTRRSAILCGARPSRRRRP